jgi:rRNA maturation endonuclease Nob1
LGEGTLDPLSLPKGGIMFKCLKCNVEYEIWGDGECKVCGSSLVSVVPEPEIKKEKEVKKGK